MPLPNPRGYLKVLVIIGKIPKLDFYQNKAMKPFSFRLTRNSFLDCTGKKQGKKEAN